MILGYLVRKINILLFVFIMTGCSAVKNNISNLNEVFFKEEDLEIRKSEIGD